MLMDIDQPRQSNIKLFGLQSDNISTDVTVLNKFYTRNEHRLVQAKIYMHLRSKRNKLIKREPYPNPSHPDTKANQISKTKMN